MPHEHYLETTRTARYYTHGALSDKTTHIWIVTHGYGMLGRYFIEKFTSLNEEKHFVIVPEALNRMYIEGMSGKVGASWMTFEDRENEIKDYVAYLDKVYETCLGNADIKGKKIIGLGFSQGVATISRWANQTKHAITNLVFWAGSVGTELLEKNNISAIPCILVVGDKDQYVTEQHKKEFLAKFSNAFANLEIKEYEGDHSIEKTVLQELADAMKHSKVS